MRLAVRSIVRWLRRNIVRAGPLVCALILGGCGRGRVLTLSQPEGQFPIPFVLEGQDMQLKLALPRNSQSIEPGQFQRDEICYLTSGPFRIDCFTDGSSLKLGENDSTDLLTDNPMWAVAPPASQKLSSEYMRLYGVLFLVGASIERLPQTLSDYMGEPGPHLIEAVALSRALLIQKRVVFQGFARGGNFTVSVELTDAGREKLYDALDEIGETSGPTQWVRLGAGGSSSGHHRGIASHGRLNPPPYPPPEFRGRD